MPEQYALEARVEAVMIYTGSTYIRRAVTVLVRRDVTVLVRRAVTALIRRAVTVLVPRAVLQPVRMGTTTPVVHVRKKCYCLRCYKDLGFTPSSDV